MERLKGLKDGASVEEGDLYLSADVRCDGLVARFRMRVAKGGA
jgi:hypothetical protein